MSNLHNQCLQFSLGQHTQSSVGNHWDNDNTPPDHDDDHGEMILRPKTTAQSCLLFWQQQGSTHPGHLANTLSTSKTKNANGTNFMSKPMQVLHLHPRMKRLWSIMAGDIIRSRCIASFTLSPPISSVRLVHLLIEVPMMALLVILFASLRNLIKQLMSMEMKIIRLPTFLLWQLGKALRPNMDLSLPSCKSMHTLGQGKTTYSSCKLE